MIEREAVRPADERPAAAREEHPQVGVDSVTVPTVLRLLAPRRFWSITMQGEMFRMASTGAQVSCGSRRRAYVLNVSTSWRCASMHIVSKTSDDLPLPLTPVKATSRCFGTSTSMPLRLCVRAPRISMEVTYRPEACSGAKSSTIGLLAGLSLDPRSSWSCARIAGARATSWQRAA